MIDAKYKYKNKYKMATASVPLLHIRGKADQRDGLSRLLFQAYAVIRLYHITHH